MSAPPTGRRTRIKICGLREEDDVDAAVDAGADAVGFVFHPSSPRAVGLDRAVALARRLPPFVTPVGLFVNAAPATIAAAVEALPSMLLQFHGDETAEQSARWRRPYLAVARVAPGVDLLDFATRHAGAQALLLDASVEGYGGGGKVFDWSLAAALAPSPEVPEVLEVPEAGPEPAAGVRLRVVLSGGLHAGNVAAGIRALRPWAVDVSSGVESSRGVKDAAAIRRFCDAVRAADAGTAP